MELRARKKILNAHATARDTVACIGSKVYAEFTILVGKRWGAEIFWAEYFQRINIDRWHQRWDSKSDGTKRGSGA